MAEATEKTVLITGCSSGIGEATARYLAGRGWTVYATARRPETLGELEAAGCRTLALDVTDEQSMSSAVAAVEEEQGGVGVLVNNAGYSQSGAVESVPLDRVRSQFETNVFGLLRMCQLVLPGMRQRRQGTIVNIGSMGGRLTFPGGGIYHATKHAVEALSDAMRFEVAGFGVRIVLIEPGLIRTSFDEAALATMEDAGDEDAYGRFNSAVGKATRNAYNRPPAVWFGGPPEAVAKVIERSITSRRPRPRYTVTPSAKLILGQRKLMSDRMWDRMMRTQFPQPGK